MNRAVSDRRLLKLAAFLKALPPKQFDYGQWVGADWKGSPDLSCGTKACALGWATAIPEFRRLGLRLRKSRYYGTEPVLGRTSGFSVAEKLFGLDYDEATTLFSPREEWEHRDGPEWNASAKQVARHIERFVKDRNRKAAA